MAPKGGHMMAQGWTYDVTAVDGTGKGGMQWHRGGHTVAQG